METTAPVDDVFRILYNDHHDPFSVLGAHIITNSHNSRSVAIRAYLPDAQAAWVLTKDAKGRDTEYPMTCVHEKGFFEADFYYCKGCGICARECWTQAITMGPEEQ